MLQPARTKHRKAFKGRIHGLAKGGTQLNFGAFGLKALEPNRITAREIEAARRTITRHLKRVGRVWIRVFPDVPVSKKQAGPHPVRDRRRVEAGRPRGLHPRGGQAFDPYPRRDPHGRGVSAMKIADIRGKTADQLKDELSSLRKEQFNLRFQRASGQLENVARIRVVRRDIAKIMTVLAERQRQSA